MKKLRTVVRRGRGTGAVLTPHLYQDNHFVVSKARYESEYIRVKDEAELPGWVSKGFAVRMSSLSIASHRSPSLIRPASIEIYEA